MLISSFESLAIPVNQKQGLDDKEIKALIGVVESSLHIKTKHQFLTWVQEDFQNIFPHEIMISFMKDFLNGKTYKNKFCSIYVSNELFESVLCGDDGVMDRVMAIWRRSRAPFLIEPSLGHTCDEENIISVIHKYELGNIAAHGMHDVNGEILSFFSFMRIPGGINEHHAYLLEVLIPYVHRALIHAMASDHANEKGLECYGGLITHREKEVLTWVKVGKSNWEIATILDISPRTVKNHVCNIIKKMSVQNRGHAVAKALRLNII